ncbi:MAG: hypothetical protein PF904_07860 [Kiritimatiellae bacterium]|jgi:hypothetical protein|nr:hypothetical protein [Kiritimatiellia bacterium]
MKILITSITLFTTTLLSQSLNLNNNGSYTDTRLRTPKPAQQVTYAADLPMYELAPSVVTNKSNINASLSINVLHANKIAQRPRLLIAKYNPPTIKALFRLRQQYVGLINKVAYETSDVQLEGVPNINTGYGRGRSNIIKKSSRDKETIERRTEQTAINYLQQITRTHFKIRSNAITNKHIHHFKLPPGKYVLCIQQRIKDSHSKAMLGSSTAIWWTTFTIEEGVRKELFLDESNAITWQEIFEVTRS